MSGAELEPVIGRVTPSGGGMTCTSVATAPSCVVGGDTPADTDVDDVVGSVGPAASSDEVVVTGSVVLVVAPT